MSLFTLLSGSSANSFVRFLYALALAMDVCFRLKRRDVSSEAQDPIMGSGWGYWVKDGPFRELLKDYADQEEVRDLSFAASTQLSPAQMSSCTGFSALKDANTKFSKGYATTGVGAVICARHEFWQPNGSVDIQVGER